LRDKVKARSSFKFNKCFYLSVYYTKYHSNLFVDFVLEGSKGEQKLLDILNSLFALVIKRKKADTFEKGHYTEAKFYTD